MAQLSDLEIANLSKLKPISEIARKVGITEDALEPYGHYKAKIDINQIQEQKKKESRISNCYEPNTSGEGKSTVTVGLADAFNKLNHNVTVALREPALGPTFGIKGGNRWWLCSSTSMEDINLHFNGDFHAITTANNALSAFIDNHLHQGNELGIDQRKLNGNVF